MTPGCLSSSEAMYNDMSYNIEKWVKFKNSSCNIGAAHAIYQKHDTLTQFAHQATE